MPGIVLPQDIKPDSAVPYVGRVVATLEGSNDIAAGEIVYLSSTTFGGRSDAEPRRLKVKRASATSVGRRLVAMNSGDVGDTIHCSPWAIVQMDTSAGAEGDPVYTDASGVPTLTPAANGAVGFVLGTAATVANGGAAVLCPGLYIEGGIPGADIDITDAGTYFATDNVEAALQELGLYRSAFRDQFVNATIAVADVAGSNDTTLTVDLVRAEDNTTVLGSARQVLITAADTAYEPLGGSVGLDTGVTFSAATKGSIVDSGAGWALVTTDADGEFDCTVTNTGDVTTYFVVSTATRGVSDKTLRCTVIASNSDAATWSA